MIQRRGPPARSATTLLEVLIASVLLGAAAVVVAMLSHHASQARRTAELRARIGWELTNAREQIATWPRESITPERIAQLDVSPQVAAAIEDASWTAAVDSVDQPVPATQVVLRLEGSRQGQAIRPESLVFWIPHSEGEEP